MGLPLIARKIRVALSPRSSLLRTRLSNGAVISGLNRPGYGGRGIYLFRDALEPELLHLEKLLAAGDVFIDVGANVGAFTVKAARTVGDAGLVISVEPFTDSVMRLSKNVELNGFRNVRIRALCVGRETRQSKLYLNRNKPNSFGLARIGDADSVSTLTVTLDDLCRWEEIDRLDFLKIDAEGAEEDVLSGGARTIQLFRPVIQVETTVCRSRIPPGYRSFVAEASPNRLFIPEERSATIATVGNLGWTELSS